MEFATDLVAVVSQDRQIHINELVVMHYPESVEIRVGEFTISGKTCERMEGYSSPESDVRILYYGVDLDEGIQLADDVHRVYFSLHGRWHDAAIERAPSGPKFSRIFISFPKSETVEHDRGLKGLQT